jgi:hypothetical protein
VSMPGYYIRCMGGLAADYPILPRDGHLSPPGTLRRRPGYMDPENRDLGSNQVAQKGEFRYIDSEICQHCSLIARIPCKSGSKMIANGCFWIEDRMSGQTTDCRKERKGILGSHLRPG